ncbi:hypothetical protein [Rugamonas sp.]|uniref:hypothetical protein n=1 Tax=Rugamonas sp. TaxID=1926287 RepID=UPI0026010C91|nr:hypothetical protein [Rugamonas sp.]
MKLTRSSRFVAALVTLFCLLFTQLAVAAYACPQLPTLGHAGISMQNMPGCAGMDVDQPNLCAAHCDAAHQSLDTAAAPQVMPFIACRLALVLSAGAPALSDSTGSDARAPLSHATSPPLAIRHCCLRI